MYIAEVKGVPTAREDFASLRHNADRLSQNGGHHRIPHQKMALKLVLPHFFFGDPMSVTYVSLVSFHIWNIGNVAGEES